MPGYSSIPYEAWANLEPTAKKWLLILFNDIILTEFIHPLWKKTSICLLPKKIIWSHNIADTRPIALLESVRKIFTKIINNRLANTIKSNNILSEANFAGLPGQSTMEPLSIMSSSINITKNLNKHIWIAFFDIAKAFDSVPLSSLKAAMQRIKIPPKIINISLNLLSNRKLTINYNHNLTNEIIVNNGIDQGETLAPLWWTIFYDPLISKLLHPRTNIPFNVLAYIDDLALINNKHSRLQKNINTFLDFLHMNKIKCNNEKTQIIFTGTNKHLLRKKSLILDSIPIPTLPYSENLKYLGCYFSGKNTSRATSKQIIAKSISIKKAILSTNWNGPISKQVTQWIIPSHFEYDLYVSYFNSTSIKLIQKIINGICKQKYQLERTSPNCLVNSPVGLNVINIEHKFQTSLAKLLPSHLANCKTSPLLCLRYGPYKSVTVFGNVHYMTPISSTTAGLSLLQKS
jgi:hypothetical protein